MPAQPSRLPLGFRSDVQGLRAIAILLVIAAHAGVPWLRGGFVGVDVFFVLSGYLITGLLVTEMRATGTINFAAFYARRLRRLLPGLLLMLVVTCLLGWQLLAPADQPAQAIAAGTAALWLSNIHFAFSHAGYFAPSTDTNLFLHTWSLGVEEQFYLAWPLLLALVTGLWNRTRPPGFAGWLKLAMVAVFAASLLLCLYWTQHRPLLAFYMMPTRAWQFALGALVFLQSGAPQVMGNGSARTIPSPAPPRAWTRQVGWLGLVLIAASAIVLDRHLPYPGWRALLPALGASAVLAAGARRPHLGAGRLLSLRPMQAIGRVSYAWYLWHWPVLLLGAQLVRHETPAYRLALVGFSWLLATAAYHLLETPIRRNARLLKRPVIAVMAALGLMAAANVSAIEWHNRAQWRLAQPGQVRFEMARLDAPLIYRMSCDEWGTSVRLCTFGSSKARHTAIAIGDSVALQWFPAYAKIFVKPDWRLIVMTKSACPMVDEPVYYARIDRVYTECAAWRKQALLTVAYLKPDVVILGSTDSYDYSRSQWINGTDGVLRSIAKAAGRIYIIRATPHLAFDGPSCLAPRSWLYSTLSDRVACTSAAQSTRNDDVFAWLRSATRPFGNVTMLDMNGAVCPEGLCRAEVDGMVAFRDGQHMSATFAHSLAGTMATRLDAATFSEPPPHR